MNMRLLFPSKKVSNVAYHVCALDKVSKLLPNIVLLHSTRDVVIFMSGSQRDSQTFWANNPKLTLSMLCNIQEMFQQISVCVYLTSESEIPNAVAKLPQVAGWGNLSIFTAALEL